MIFNGITNEEKVKLAKAITSDNISSQSVSNADTVDGKHASEFASSSHTHDDRYYTESEMNTKLSGKSDTGHKHTKADITDFPSSLPASDVYSWAKQSSKPSYTASEVGALASGGTAVNSSKVCGYAVSFDSSTGTLSFTS